MRLFARVTPFVAVCTMIVVILVSGCGAEEASETPGREAGSAVSGEQETDASVEPVAAEQEGSSTVEVDTVVAPLRYMDQGEEKVKEVPYLPAGTKVATLETTKGTIKIELWEEEAPNTVINFVHIANSGRYDGVAFHRVIGGFMAQTGDVEHKGGRGGPGYTIPAEFDAQVKHERGVVSMARASDPNSGGSQFFIMFTSASHLDGKYAAFGQVTEGMEVVDSIKKGSQEKNGMIEGEPDKIVGVRVESIPE